MKQKYNKNDGDLEVIEAINQAAEVCSRDGFLAFEKTGFSSEIANNFLKLVYQNNPAVKNMNCIDFRR